MTRVGGRDRARRGGFPMKIVKMAIECDDGAVLEWSTDNVWLRRSDGVPRVTADDGACRQRGESTQGSCRRGPFVLKLGTTVGPQFLSAEVGPSLGAPPFDLGGGPARPSPSVLVEALGLGGRRLDDLVPWRAYLGNQRRTPAVPVPEADQWFRIFLRRPMDARAPPRRGSEFPQTSLPAVITCPAQTAR